MAGSVGILSLPDELLSPIFAHYLEDPYTPEDLWQTTLHPKDPASIVRGASQSPQVCVGRQTLLALALSCRRFHLLANPYLYHTFPSSTAMWYPGTSRIPLRVAQFLVSLLCNPSLVHHIRRVILHPLAATFWAHESPFFPSQPPEYATILRRLQSAANLPLEIVHDGLDMNELAVKFQARLQEASQQSGFVLAVPDSQPVEAQLLLSLAPRLNTLIWSDWRSDGDDEVAGLLSLAPKSLKELMIEYSYGYDSLTEWAGLDRLRELRRCGIKCGCRPRSTTGVARNNSKLPEQVKNMVDLRISGPCVKRVKDLVAGCRSLSKLYIRLDVDFRMREVSQSWGRVSGSWAEVVDELCTNQSLFETLDHLTLDSTIKEDEVPIMTTDNWPVSLRSLQQFRKLKSLHIHQSAFLSFEAHSSFPIERRPLAQVLPHELETIGILCFDVGLLGQMSEFVYHLSDYPELKRIEVQMGDFCCYDVNRAYPPHNLIRSSEDHIENLYQEFSKRGISFVETT